MGQPGVFDMVEMTKRKKINEAWEKRKGGCVHDFQLDSPTKAHCKKCPKELPKLWAADNWTEPELNDLCNSIPDHTTDPAVFKECVVELWNGGWQCLTDTHYNERQWENRDTGELSPIDPDPQLAAMKAVLTKEGRTW
jgi:hypothetical protein